MVCSNISCDVGQQVDIRPGSQPDSYITCPDIDRFIYCWNIGGKDQLFDRQSYKQVMHSRVPHDHSIHYLPMIYSR